MVQMRNYDQNLESLPRQRAWVEINLAALDHNVRQICSVLGPQTELLAVVKADAYGHGAVAIAQTALGAGASWLGVATILEGIELRRAGIQAPILLLGAIHTPAEIGAVAQWRIQPTVCTPKQALVFSEALDTIQRPLAIHLKLDTGMSRLGSPWQEALEFAQWVQRLPNLEIASVYSHCATADDPDQTTLWQQKDHFDTAIDTLQSAGLQPPRLHLANSAATLVDPNLHYDMVRVGLLLYGLYPAPHFSDRIDLKPVLSVKARVTQVKTLPPGTGISYGHRYRTHQKTRIAVVGIGYADGVPRNLSNQMRVLIRGQQVAQLGAVTMDQLMIDISNVPGIEPGEVVTLLGESQGEQITADNWANQLGTISWEILCGFKHRLPRVAIDNTEASPTYSLEAH
ncbi:MAG: alanine racemase [Cyanobacteria bacterium P01_H01_bin.121]